MKISKSCLPLNKSSEICFLIFDCVKYIMNRAIWLLLAELRLCIQYVLHICVCPKHRLLTSVIFVLIDGRQRKKISFHKISKLQKSAGLHELKRRRFVAIRVTDSVHTVVCLLLSSWQILLQSAVKQDLGQTATKVL